MTLPQFLPVANIGGHASLSAMAVNTDAIQAEIAASGGLSILATYLGAHSAAGGRTLDLAGQGSIGDGFEGRVMGVPASGQPLGGMFFASADVAPAPVWYWKRLTEVIGPRLWGAKGTGLVDDSAAWMAQRDDVRALGGRDIVVPPGLHRVDATQWAKGLINGKISGYGAKIFRGENTDTFDHQTPFWGNSSPFYTDGWASPSLGGTLTFGFKIATVGGSVGSVTCLTVSDAANFHEGDWVLIYGYAGWGASFPPWARHFEYARVVSANASTGAVVLDRYLADEYRQDWYDFGGPYGCGAARILNCTRADYVFADKLVYEGFECQRNPNITDSATNGGCYFTGGDKIIVRDLVIPYAIPTTAGDIIFQRCKIGLVELDKLVRSVIFEDCDLGVGKYQDALVWPHTCGVQNGNSVKRVEFRNCRIYGTSHNIAAREAIYRGCDIYSTTPLFRGGGLAGYVAFAAGYSNWQTKVVVEDCYIAHPTTIDAITDGGAKAGFKVAASPTPTATTCAVSDTWDQTAYGGGAWRALAAPVDYSYLLSSLEAGQRIRTAAGKTCLVRSVTWDAVHSCFIVTGEFSVAPVAGEEWLWSTLASLEIKRPRLLGADANIPKGLLIPSPLAQRVVTGREDAGRQVYVWTERDVRQFAGGTGGYAAFIQTINGRLLKLTVDVKKAYTGASADCNLYLDEDADSGRRRIVNLKATGVRVCDFPGAYGADGSDTIAATTGAHCVTINHIVMSPSGPWAYPLWDSPADLPIYTIIAEVSKDR